MKLYQLMVMSMTGIYGLMKSYTESIKRNPVANRGMEIRDNFNNMQDYRQRPETSPNMSTLPLHV